MRLGPILRLEAGDLMIGSPFGSATQLAADVREGRTTSEALTTAYAARIREHNPALHALVQSDEERALRDARVRDSEVNSGHARGPLHGVPVTVKESFDMEGLRTTVNFRRLADNVARSDSYVVRRLREAGAVILGKTNIPTMLSDFQSFGPIYPTAASPWDDPRGKRRNRKRHRGLDPRAVALLRCLRPEADGELVHAR